MQNRENLTINEITEAIIGAAIEVHRTLGPGLLESAYQECLARELTLRQIAFEREKPLLLEYKGVKLECGYRLDFLVAGMVVVEVKAAESVLPSGRNLYLVVLPSADRGIHRLPDLEEPGRTERE